MLKRLYPRSIRARLTTIATVVAAVVFAVASALVLINVPDNLYGAVDGRVDLAVRRVAGETRVGRLPQALDVPSRVHLIEAVDDRGRIMGVSPGLNGGHLPAFPVARPDVVYSAERKLTGVSEETETDYLIKAMRVDTPRGPVTVYAAASLSEVNRATRLIHTVIALGVPLVIMLVGVLTWLAVGAALRPVSRIRSELAVITGQDLSRRVSVPTTDDEISRLAATTNDTLDRLERSAETQRRFVADASHELRSPISALRTQLEVANAYPDETDWRATGARTLASAERLASIIDELLMLARLDAGAVPDRRAVDLCRLALEQARRREGGRVPVVLHSCGPALVHGSSVQLDRLLTNLLDNATRHAASRIDLEVAVEGDEVVVTVTDDGGGIAPEDRERVFERFTRLPDARRMDKDGSGLGLPLSREIAVVHGGSLAVAEHEPGARLVARLPLHKP
ncbi:ATP-binding protein [Nonomuraea pusilla]|uniref:sensor histidine kinase n=1 Tax=Nonomuraea pusilla TaxID=46177 RepID=UPI0033294118